MIALTSRTSRRPLATLFFAFAPTLLGGCATMFTGTVDVLSFQANVPEVRLSIDGRYRGDLPITLDVSRNFVSGQQFIARFEKAGYETQVFRLAREFNTVAILDVSSTPVSGGVDVLTGALMKFSPLDYHVQMRSLAPDAGAGAQRRSAELHRFALTNFRALQRDLARGGGEYLSTFVGMLGGGDDVAVRRISEASLRGAPELLGAPSAGAFVERFNGLLGASPELRSYQL